MKEVKRPKAKGLHLVDATSAAGGAMVDPQEFDVYYFAPQKSFGSDGGLFTALMSPAAIERIKEIKATNRWIPPFLDLTIALENSRLQQTYNTPSLSTIHMFENQVSWFNQQGGLSWSSNKSKQSTDYLYEWANQTRGVPQSNQHNLLKLECHLIPQMEKLQFLFDFYQFFYRNLYQLFHLLLILLKFH